MDVLLPVNLVAWAIQAGVIVLVAAPLPRLLGLWSPRVRMMFWRVVLVACLLLPLLQPWTTPVVTELETGRAPLPAIGANLEVQGAAPASDVLQPASSQMPPASARWAWPSTTVVRDVIVAGIVLRLGWLGLGLITVSRLRRAASRLWPRPQSIDRAATLAETDAEFLLSPTTSRPVTCGVLWPVVMVPRNFESFPEHEQTAIACHELLHVSRSDWVRNAFDEIVRAVLWFHPAVWWLINQIQLTREQVVDREAVKRLGMRQPYLEALLRLAKPAPRLIMTPASLFLKRAHLRQRVTLLVKEASMSRARLVASFVIMAVVVFMGGRLVTSAFPLQQSGARTPGVQTAALLDQSKPLTLKFGAGIPVQQVLGFISQAAGLTLTTEGDLRQSLSTPVGPIELSEVTIEQALGAVLRPVGLTYRVTGPHTIVVRRAEGALAGGVAGGVPGGVAGASRPGTMTGTGTGSGIGSGSGSGVAGGVTGGIVGGVSGGVGGGVGSGVSGGLRGGGSVGITGVLSETPTASQAGGNPPTIGVLGGTGVSHSVVSRVDPAPMDQPSPVVVKVTVEAGGSVTDVQVASAPGAGDGEAVNAARQWVFAPSASAWTTYIGFSFAGLSSGGAPVSVGGVIRPPRKVRDVKPIYPAEAQESKIQGVQIVEANLGPAGDVIDAWILRGHEVLIPAALDAVLRWKFEPALVNGEPISLKMTVTVNFTLQNGPSPSTFTMPPLTGGVSPVTAQYEGAATWPANAIRVGGDIRPPTKTYDVKAVYPEVASKARVQGVVICEVLIGPDGKVMDARILRSIPLLDQAAYDAVRQWEFTPTLLNGNPIPVIMTVTVNFTLQ